MRTSSRAKCTSSSRSILFSTSSSNRWNLMFTSISAPEPSTQTHQKRPIDATLKPSLRHEPKLCSAQERGALPNYHSPSLTAFCPPGATARRSPLCCAGLCVDLWFGRYSLDQARRTRRGTGDKLRLYRSAIYLWGELRHASLRSDRTCASRQWYRSVLRACRKRQLRRPERAAR